MMTRRSIPVFLTVVTLAGASSAQTLEAEKSEMELAMDPEPKKGKKKKKQDDGNHFVIGVDLDAGIPLDEEDVERAMGGALRFGWQSKWTSWLTGHPELVGSAYFFEDDNGPKLYRGLAGFRFAYESFIRFGVFSHAGMGRVDSPVEGATRTSFAWDAGAEFGVIVIPLLGLGLHGAYNSATNGKTPENFNYVSAGLHIELRL